MTAEKRQTYTAEFKREAVRRVLAHGQATPGRWCCRGSLPSEAVDATSHGHRRTSQEAWSCDDRQSA